MLFFVFFANKTFLMNLKQIVYSFMLFFKNKCFCPELKHLFWCLNCYPADPTLRYIYVSIFMLPNAARYLDFMKKGVIFTPHSPIEKKHILRWETLWNRSARCIAIGIPAEKKGGEGYFYEILRSLIRHKSPQEKKNTNIQDCHTS